MAMALQNTDLTKSMNRVTDNLRGYFLISACVLGSMKLLSAATLYGVTDLGHLGPVNDYTISTGLNNAGQVVGYSNSAVFLYSDGRMTDLGAGYFAAQFWASSGLLGGDKVAINDAGQVTGMSDRNSAFLYSNGKLINVGPSGSSGHAVNNVGQVTGSLSFLGPLGVLFYSNGQSISLGIGGIGYSINDAGQIAGGGYGAGSDRAFLYSNGQVTDLGFGVAYGINSAGQVVGGDGDAFLYTDGQTIHLGTLPGGLNSVAYDINDAGQIVGEATTSRGLARAFLYTNGQMMNLNDLIDPTLGITLEEAEGINDNGQIAASGAGHAYLLTPVPEPATWMLSALAVFLRLTKFRTYKTI